MTTGLIITAAGTGSRFGLLKGKQFIDILGKPLLIHTCERFSDIPGINEVIITVQKGNTGLLEEYLSKYDIHLPYKVIEGGLMRKDSVKKAFDALSSNTEFVMVHDGARPNISRQLIKSLMEAVQINSAVIPVIPVVDTIKLVEEDKVKETLPRNKLFCVQTPQVFKYELLKESYSKDIALEVTDEAMLVEKLGIEIKVVEGERENIKLTYPSDLILLETFMS
ncbi:MAG: 2-C-methyl-D-erythritol 4-phosphate cytidylyltransferase [bacterium]|nr:2-C-methyl-D-erythritol 4-phosphate cytidylyltransferase [bacterium]